MTERDDSIAEDWDRAPNVNEEYIIKVVVTAGVNADIEAAMKAGAQLICDVATVEGVMCEVTVGRVDREVSYTPRPSMTSHVIVYDVENGVAVRSGRRRAQSQGAREDRDREAVKIVLMKGFSSSSIFDATTRMGRDQSSQFAFMGGEDFSSQFDDADVVIAHWGPEVEPIVLRCPDGVEIVGAQWAHLKEPRLVPSMTPEEWRERSFPDE